jgi:hypothetical protein
VVVVRVCEGEHCADASVRGTAANPCVNIQRITSADRVERELRGVVRVDSRDAERAGGAAELPLGELPFSGGERPVFDRVGRPEGASVEGIGKRGERCYGSQKGE